MPRLSHVLARCLPALGAAALAWGIGAASALTPAHATGPLLVPARADSEPPVLVIAMSGLAWSDATSGAAPTLARLAETDASIGSLVVRTVRPVTCPAAGWLTLSAGARAAAASTNVAGGGATCPDLAEPNAGRVPGWAAYLSAQGSAARPAPIGLLGQTIAAAGVTAVGIGPGAAVALAGPDGSVSAGYEPLGDAAAQVARAAHAGARLVVVDAGQVDRVGAGRAHEAAHVDSVLRDALRGWRLATGTSGRVVIASIGDDDAGAGLRVLATDGAGLTGRFAGSPSTHHADLAQVPDVTATVATLTTGHPVGSGTDLVVAGQAGEQAATRLAGQVDLARHAAAIAPLTMWFWVAAGLTALGASLWACRRLRAGAPPRRGAPGGAMGRSALGWVEWLCLAAASLPVASFLANAFAWWRFAAPAVALATLTAAIAACIGVGLAAIARRRPLGAWGVLGAATAGTLCVDVATGGWLQFCSPFGLPLLNGGRFYGFSNTAFGLLVAGAIMAATVAARIALRAGRRPLAAAVVAAIGVVVLAIDAAPSLGADFGGPIPLVIGFAVLVGAVAGWRWGWRRALLVVAAAALILAAVSLWDYSRGAEHWSHLGGFVDQVTSGQAWGTIGAKARANGVLLAAALPAAALVAVLAWRVGRWLRPTGALPELIARFAPLGSGLVAAAVTGLVATPINDSGGAIVAAGAMVLVPSLAPALAAARLSAATTPPRDLRPECSTCD